MKIVCSGCGKDLGEKEGDEGLVSHGLCEECGEVMIADIKHWKETNGRNKKEVK